MINLRGDKCALYKDLPPRFQPRLAELLQFLQLLHSQRGDTRSQLHTLLTLLGLH